MEGFLGFKCAATVTGTSLLYEKTGTDAAVFNLGSPSIKVLTAAVGTKPPNPAMTLKYLADKSKASSTVVEGECPGMGDSWIQLVPRSWGSKPLASEADVRAAAAKDVVGAADRYKKEQWCNKAVQKAGDKSECTFDSASKAEYSAMLYCLTIENWFFASSAGTNVTAADNGGKPVSLSLTYGKAIDEVADNAVVLNICKSLAEHLAVPYERVTDKYGGYHGKPSSNLPAVSSTAAASTNATNASTTRMLNTTANATVN